MIISFNGLKANSGKKTIALTAAKILSDRGNRVLFVDLDYQSSDYALTYGLEHPTSNTEAYFERAIKEGQFNIAQAVYKASNLKGGIAEPTEHFADNIHFLTFGKKKNIEKMQMFVVQQWSTEQCYGFMKKFIAEIKVAPYDYVILVLPVGLDDMFNLPCILESDYVFNIIKFNKYQMELAKDMVVAYRFQDNENESKFRHVLNELPKKLSDEQIKRFAAPVEISSKITFDESRAINEINGIVGASSMNKEVSDMLATIGINVAEKKQGFLSKFGRGG